MDFQSQQAISLKILTLTNDISLRIEPRNLNSPDILIIRFQVLYQLSHAVSSRTDIMEFHQKIPIKDVMQF